MDEQTARMFNDIASAGKNRLKVGNRFQ